MMSSCVSSFFSEEASAWKVSKRFADQGKGKDGKGKDEKGQRCKGKDGQGKKGDQKGWTEGCWKAPKDAKRQGQRQAGWTRKVQVKRQVKGHLQLLPLEGPLGFRDNLC